MFQWEYYSLGKRYMFLADFWFLLALFFSSIIFFPIADAVLNSKPKTLLTAGGLLAATGIMRHFAVDLPYNIQLIPFWCAFMLLGAFFGQNGLFEIEGLSGAKGWLAAVAALAAGTAMAMVITPSVNLFRGSFAEPEAVSLVLVSVSSLLIIWGLGEVCRLIELAGARVTELSWLGSHTMTVYLFHVFIAWLISILTGYPLSYDPAAVTAGTVVKSLLFACAVLAICIGIDIGRDRLAQQKS